MEMPKKDAAVWDSTADSGSFSTPQASLVEETPPIESSEPAEPQLTEPEPEAESEPKPEPTPAPEPKPASVSPTIVLQLKNTCLAPGDLKRIWNGQKLKGLSLKYCYVDFLKKKSHEQQLLQELVLILQESTQLETLELAGLLPRHNKDVLKIITALASHKNLVSLAISVPEENRVSFSLKSWIQLLQNNKTTLNKLTLEGFDLTDQVGTIENTMIPGLSNLLCLRQLSLTSCRISDKSLFKLIHGLDYLKRLEKLQLPLVSPRLTHISLLTMANLLQLNNQLRTLNLTGNAGLFADVELDSNMDIEKFEMKTKQREQALTAFFKSLQDNTTLTELNLSYCGMGDAVFKFLLVSLERNRKLSSLNLNYNQITTKVGLNRLLREMLPNFRAPLSKLYFKGLQRTNVKIQTSIHDETLGDVIVDCRDDFPDGPRSNEDMDMADNRPWNQQQLRVFLQALEENKTLTVLDLDENKQTERITDVLDRNQTVQKLHKFNPHLVKDKTLLKVQKPAKVYKSDPEEMISTTLSGKKVSMMQKLMGRKKAEDPPEAWAYDPCLACSSSMRSESLVFDFNWEMCNS